ncbi:SagB family peptide dehydrogenase [Pseudomonas vanderleydeniana]|uniref:SagB/ThcOx family dehydrogenase n=1 Tax=Pseudomonas vanderleydeniana TaxID=2745495 RepID=A0A9E6PK61_9PSED|nr:SagB family peptide dehydrogenase [Pseudomonas vanderleydeniana]QXI28237.1 SagB/ThcOx family dehydrogenase [Pseudomonas vanderleydeniana]
MHINPDLFILIKPPALVIWNYKSHEQYSVDRYHADRLIELVEKPSRFDPTHPVDSTFVTTGILSENPFTRDHWGWDDLSRIFHMGTRDLPMANSPASCTEWARNYLAHCREVMRHPQPPPHRHATALHQDLIQLPTPLPEHCEANNNEFTTVLLHRKTCRKFLNWHVSLEQLSTILYLSLGYLRERELDIDPCIPQAFRSRRSSPSGGGLNCSEGYVYIRNVDGIGPGFYYYHPDKHALTLTRGPGISLATLVQGQHFIENLPFGVFITCRFDKMWWKYPHSQGYRVALLEAGHVSQTFQLAATALGLGTWVTAALTEQKIEQALHLEGLSEQPLLFVGAGYSHGETICDELRELLKTPSENH